MPTVGQITAAGAAGRPPAPFRTSVGECLRARVVSVDDGSVRLGLRGAVLEARTSLDLPVGSLLLVQVVEVSAERVALRVIGDTPPGCEDTVAAEPGTGPATGDPERDALVGAGLDPTPENAARLARSALAGPCAHASAEARALLLAAGVDATPGLGEAIDAVLADPPAAGPLADRDPTTTRVLGVLSPARQGVPELAATLQAAVRAATVTGHSSSGPLTQPLAALVRGLQALPLLRAEAGAPMPFVYTQIPVRVGRRHRAGEVRARRLPHGANGEAALELRVRVDTATLGRVDACARATGVRLSVLFRVERPRARALLDAGIGELRSRLASQGYRDAGLAVRVVRRLEPLARSEVAACDQRA